ncbi:hypothetical protein [Erythrobacter sp. JK5]|uniref:hypothetical protein n=1 Tax=Erythrobacter sp. JK5 TaxID=2829500 RepID=UPI001BA6D1EF|nr:hypothetical protein [Erythrobacter sp. JK5]QUL36741.1 hypothetical protein KDC96_09950 [Erythrobacter sp. JK5]
MSVFSKSRFNPAPGIADFWHEVRKPNPYRWPILFVSMLPFGVVLYWLSGETVYKDPERPSISYITTFDPDRTDDEITASNLENQEVKELREQAEADLAQRKRDLYKALGAAAGMDVEEIEQRADAERAAAEAEEQAQRDAMFGRSAESTVNRPAEGSNP